jgi:hypothetical protein
VNELARQRPALVCGALVALHLVLAALVFEPSPHHGGDNGVYVTLARSLLEHGTYSNLHEPGSPPHTQYPPGFPLLLAGALLIGLTSWVQLKLVIITLSAVAVAASFLWIRRRGRPALAIGVALLLAISPAVLEQSHWVLSDTPFWAFTMLAIWAYERMPAEQRTRFLAALALTLVAYFMRSAGLPLVLAAGIFLVRRRHWREAAALALAIGVPALLWWLRARSLGGVDYVNQFWHVNPYAPELGTIGVRDFLERIASNVQRYTMRHTPMLLAGSTGPLPVVLSLGVLVFGIFGWLGNLRRARVAEWFTPLYLGLILIWPAVWSGERFLLPALPLLLFYAGDAFVRLARWIRPGTGFAAGAAVAGTIVLFAMPALARDIQHGTTCSNEYRAGHRYACMPRDWVDFYGVAEWAREHLPADAVVVSRKPSLFYLASGLPGGYYPLSDEPHELFGVARRLGARYVVLDRMDSLSPAYLAPILLRRPDAFCLIVTSGEAGTALLGIVPAAERVPDADIEPGRSRRTFEVCDAGYLRRPPGSL